MNQNLQGREYWRSLAQRAAGQGGGTPEFRGYDPATFQGSTRREFLTLMGAAMALAGLTLTGCRRWPEQEIRPHATQPEGFTPGEAVWYATMLERDGVARGLLARSYDGRPIKIEGNPLHPDSRGAADALSQAAVLDLYDPDRSRAVLNRRKPGARPALSSWSRFDAFLDDQLQQLTPTDGQGLAILAQPSAAPTMTRLREAVARRWPRASWHTYAPLHRDADVQGALAAFGRPLRSQLNLAKAEVIACFDADLLSSHPQAQRHARDWATQRDPQRPRCNRLYAVESGLSLTGAAADHRLPLSPARVAQALAALAHVLGVAPAVTVNDSTQTFIRSLAEDLLSHRGEAVVAAGPALGPAAHALTHAINHRLGAVDEVLTYTREPVEEPCARSLAALQQRLDRGAVRLLLVLGGNPVFDGGLELGSSFAGQALHLSESYNETSNACHWHLPQAHFLECWGDGRAWDGTVSIQQPLIRPLYDGRSPLELLAALAGEETDGRALVRRTLEPMLGANPDAAWDDLLRTGVLAGSAWDVERPGQPLNLDLAELMTTADRGDAMEALFIADASVHDGRHANNGWLQEMPDPITQLVWDNAAQLSKHDADRLGLATGDEVELSRGGVKIRIPVMVQPGVARGTVVLPVGYGRRVCGPIGRGVGYDVFPLRRVDAATAWLDAITPTGRRRQLVMTQEHHLLDAVGAAARDRRIGPPQGSGTIIREDTWDRYRADHELFHRQGKGHGSLKLYAAPSAFNEPHAWGMAIDLNKCIGCNACLVACQAENNVPVVGKREVARHREMHWLRIDRYYKGDIENPQVVHQPLACGQCETAPCEQVCPVAATVHDSEGLNTMVYNRCIGTRYCSNNCPYKVRRFNYFDWHSRDPRTAGDTPPWLGIPDQQQQRSVDPVRALGFNPQVTVRMRGVMEKCTYCTQRIQQARIQAKLEHAAGSRDQPLVRDGEVTPACAGTCPTQAIVFGDLNDPGSAVARLHADGRAYGLLDELLDLRPRTRYLAKLRHPRGEQDQETHA
jgi:molybdopterin-containing oxidoreductase family iron-sulfur binding subunit